MAYEKHTWETGEVITAEKLNNLENGIHDIPETMWLSIKFRSSSEIDFVFYNGSETIEGNAYLETDADDSGNPILIANTKNEADGPKADIAMTLLEHKYYYANSAQLLADLYEARTGRTLLTDEEAGTLSEESIAISL